ncbi:PAS domain S-box protein [Microbacterium sp.]|uniref:PAS domain S-box protein n=1 Tax=Microbacterium sp. TaxID=51671 RepID=UPI003A8E495B
MTLDRLGATSWPHEVAGRLLDVSGDVACVAGFDGWFHETTGAWEALFGWSADELRSRPLLEFVHPDDVAATADRLQAVRLGGHTAQFEHRFLAADGSARWLTWTAVAVPEDEAYWAVARDVTASHAAAARLRESERRYLDIIDSAHDIVQSILPDGHFEFVNRAWHDSLGYTADELPGLTLFDIVVEADHAHCEVVIGQIMSGHSFDQVGVTFVRKDGSTFPVEGNATGRFRDGVFVATHTFFRDVSDKREAEALQAAYQHRLEQEVAERTAAAVQSEKLATLGRLAAGMAHELNNPAAAAQRGAALLGDAFAQTSASLLALSGDAADADDEVGADGAGPEHEPEHTGPTGPEGLADLLARTAAPDSDPLAHSDREAAIEDWLDAHRLGEAWQAAASLADLGVTDADLDALAAALPPAQLPAALSAVAASHTARTLIDQVRHGAARISEIVAALKDYSYMDRAPVQDVDVHGGLDSTLVMLRSKLSHGVTVHRDYASDVPRIEALGSELNQVWTNLIDNAVDAMDGEGTLTVRTRAESGGVAVEIEDDGPGIPDDVAGKIFDPFFTTKPLGRGTGLGLHIVFNMIRGSGGRIDVHSQPGRTVFHVWLPPRLPDAATAPEAEERA